MMPTIARNREAKAARGAPGDVRDAIRGPDNNNPSKSETHIVNEVLDVLVQTRRNKRAALKLMRTAEEIWLWPR
jgi:hypothetical protein